MFQRSITVTLSTRSPPEEKNNNVRGGPQRWVMGSITERVLGATRLPLLIVRPQRVETKQEVVGQVAAANKRTQT